MADEVEKLYPVESRHFKKLVDHHGRFWARPPLGESRFDVQYCLYHSSWVSLVRFEFW
jgi:hypothetical protein